VIAAGIYDISNIVVEGCVGLKQCPSSVRSETKRCMVGFGFQQVRFGNFLRSARDTVNAVLDH